MALSILISGCGDKTYTKYEKYCPEFEIKLPTPPEGKLEPVGMLDVVDKNVTHAVMHRDMSRIKDFSTHAYKNASIIDNSLVMDLYDSFGKMYNTLSLLKDQVDRDCNSSITKDK